MEKLMDQDIFRKALEDAIKGKSANQAPFSKAWATGKLQKKHFARWAENHYHYVGPFADYLGYVYSNMPEEFNDAIIDMLEVIKNHPLGDFENVIEEEDYET